MMKLKVNGELQQCSTEATVADLLEELDIPAENVVVELNRRIVTRDEFPSTRLAEADVVEIIRFVGGG